MKAQSTRARHRIRFASLALCTLVMALALAACGSDDEPAPASSDSGNAAGDTGGAAAELVTKVTADQTEWRGPTEAPAPVSGKTIGIVPCGMAIEGCARQARGGEAAAKALGWTAIMTDGQGDGAKLGEAITSLINRKVDAIYLASVNAEGFGEQLGEAEKQGIPVIASFASDPTPLGGLGEVGIDYKEAGRAVAAFMVTNGGGDVVVFNQNESPAVAARAEGLKAGLTEFGGGEVAEEQSIPNTQLGQPTADLMASILQRNPEGDLKWMFAGFDFMLTSMMQAAEQQGDGAQGRVVRRQQGEPRGDRRGPDPGRRRRLPARVGGLGGHGRAQPPFQRAALGRGGHRLQAPDPGQPAAERGRVHR